MIKKYLQFITESFFNLKNEFGISYEELGEILTYITDEFPKLEYWVENSLQSSLIKPDKNCFVIILNEKDKEYPLSIHWVEPKIFELVKDVDSHLRAFGLYVCANDFSESDAYYEIVVSKIGHTPQNGYYPRV